MSRRALLIALGVDNAGSGLFLPLTLVYVTKVVGLPLGTAGLTVAAGTVVGLLVPPVAGRLVDRAGPRPVVIGSRLVQAAGALTFLVAGDAGSVAAATVALAAGQQLFYSSLFALISDVAGDGPKDHPFAVVAMVRAGCFGLGALAAGALLTTAGAAGLRLAVAANAVSFVVCAALLATLVRAPHRRPDGVRPGRLRADRRFLSLIGITALVALAIDFFLVGLPVYVLDVLGGQPWLPGVVLALSTAVNATCATLALRATRRFSRLTAMTSGAALVVGWCAACLAALAVPVAWLPAAMLLATLILAASGLLFGTRANALAVDLAPAAARGRYLAAFQYAFTVPGVLAPAVAGLFAVATWLPWLVVGGCAALATAGLRRLR
ncbi:MFS transporter [Actinophytocola sp.]|uniref:MFS transporter n=1 Tax=Actinophytocola sp. TaxID=1872138 RepID=UPI003D6A3BA1